MALFDKSTQAYDGQQSKGTNKGMVGSTIFWRPESNEAMVYKYAHDDIRNGAIVVTHQSQRAYLFLNGALAHSIPPSGGQYKLETANIPLFAKWLNAATGGTTHSPAEIWFVNVETERAALWGLGDLPIMDHSMGVEFIIGARGGYNIKIVDGALLLMKLVGALDDFSTNEFLSYFKQKIRSIVAQAISDVVETEKLSMLSLQRNRKTLEIKVEEFINRELEAYGVCIKNFAVENFNIPEEYREVLKEQTKGLAERKRLDQLGVAYAQERHFDIMDNAAKNEGGTVGSLMGAGMGLTMGAGVGQAMGNSLNQGFSQASSPTAPPPIPQAKEYYLAINGQQAGPMGVAGIQEMINQAQANSQTLYWCQGMGDWEPISSSTELTGALKFLPPAIPTL
ncbi:MAG: SPFH domain-containing protein [Rikenellaceae bacterium]